MGALNEAESSKKRLQVENQDLQRQIEETENSIAALSKQKISITTQLEDTKRLGDAEARDRASLLSKFKGLTTELENIRDKIEQESEAKAESQLWRSKYETEGLGRIDELEGAKTKISARLGEVEDLQMEYERVHAAAVISEKRGRNFDKVVGE